MLQFNLPSPLQQVQNHGFDFDLYVKRDDLIHEYLSGNKYRKLKYNLAHYQNHKYKGIISFGGAYSNHLHALSAMCAAYKIPCVAIVRGEDDADNPTLNFMRSAGLHLHFVTRTAYREKENALEIKSIINTYPDYFIVPEGGSSPYALPGLVELVDELVGLPPFDYLLVAAGTGYTAAGILQGLVKNNLDTKLFVISALKGNFLHAAIAKAADQAENSFMFSDEYALGGYAKTNATYLKFIDQFERNTGVPVDPIYNGKVIYALAQLNETSFFQPSAKVLWINTGGLQGIDGMKHRGKM